MNFERFIMIIKIALHAIPMYPAIPIKFWAEAVLVWNFAFGLGLR